MSKRVELKVSLLDVPPIFDFIRNVAVIATEGEGMDSEQLRGKLSDALDELARSLNTVED